MAKRRNNADLQGEEKEIDLHINMQPEKLMIMMAAVIIGMYIFYFYAFNYIYMTDEKLTEKCQIACSPRIVDHVIKHKFTFSAKCKCAAPLVINHSQIEKYYINRSIYI